MAGMEARKPGVDSRTRVSTNNLEAFWMPFTANRQFKKAPRMLVGAEGMYYRSADGRQVLEQVKSDTDLTDIPVVVLTTSAAEEDILRSYKLHANAYVTKPVDLDQFIRAVRQIDEFFVQVVRLPRR